VNQGQPVQPAVFNLKGFCTYVGISTVTGWRLVNNFEVEHERPTPKTIRISKLAADKFRQERTIRGPEDLRRYFDRRRKQHRRK
jgi:hypothetical protein